MAGKSVTSRIVIAAQDKFSKVFGRVKKSLGTLKDSVFNLKTAVAAAVGAAGVGALGKSFLDAARTVENYKVRLQVLLGSQEQGNRLFKEMADYASRVPFEFEQIMGGATQLAGILKGGVDEIKQWMPLIGDLAAASGLGIAETTEQVSRMLSAGAASADLFRERGVLSMLGFQAGVSYSAEETKKKLMEAWNATGSQFKGATDKMAGTWDGMMSMLSDAWFSFRSAVMESGVFEYFKTAVQTLLQTIERFKKDGNFEAWAKQTANAILQFFKSAINILPTVLLTTLKAVALLSQGMRGLQLLWDELKVSSLGYMARVQLVLGILAMAIKQILQLGNVGGIFNERISELDKFASGQADAIKKITKERDDAVAAQRDHINGMNDEQAKFGEMEKSVEGLEKGMKNFASAIDVTIEQNRKAAEASKATADSVVSDIERQIEAYRRLQAAQGRFISDTQAANELNNGGISGLNAAARSAERTG